MDAWSNDAGTTTTGVTKARKSPACTSLDTQPEKPPPPPLRLTRTLGAAGAGRMFRGALVDVSKSDLLCT